MLDPEINNTIILCYKLMFKETNILFVIKNLPKNWEISHHFDFVHNFKINVHNFDFLQFDI